MTVDGSEGGTGAAPVEFAMHIGSPLRMRWFSLITVCVVLVFVIVSK